VFHAKCVLRSAGHPGQASDPGAPADDPGAQWIAATNLAAALPPNSMAVCCPAADR
jgi:hypothetical protein